MKERKKGWDRPVRLKLIENSSGIPEHMKRLLVGEMEACQAAGRKHMAFALNELPLSLNHQYDHTQYRKKVFNPRTMSHEVVMRGGKKLKPEVHAFRDWVTLAIGHQRFDWKATGPLSCYVFFQSPYWVTKERKVRQVDVDNRVKPLLDAIEKALDTPDELIWSLHTYKVLGPKERTTVYLFDLGDVVDYHKS